MTFWSKGIRFLYYSLFLLVPLIFLPNTSELFEFNKIILTYIFTALIVGFWLADCITQKKIIFRHTPLDVPLLIFLGFEILSLMFSIDVHTSWFGYYSRWNGGFLSLFSYSLLYWAFVTHFDAKSARTALNFALWGSLPVALWGTLEHFGIDAKLWVQDVQSRVFSTIGQPNWLAAYLVALIFIPVSHTLRKFSWVYLTLSLLLLCVLLFTNSRSGILAFGVSSLLFWLVYLIKFHHFQAKAVKNFFLASLLILLPLIVFPNPLRNLVSTKFSPPSQSTSPSVTTGPALETGGTESGIIRRIVWTGALRIWQASSKNLWLGTGPETFTMAYYRYRPIEHNQTSEWELLYNKAHNEFLNQLSTTGILGFGSYLLLLTAMLWLLLKPVHANHSSDQLLSLGLLASWLTIPITNFWGFSVVITQIIMFLLPGFAIILASDTHPVPAHPGSLTTFQKTALILVLALTSYLSFVIIKYWYADTRLASAQIATHYFQSTQDPQYLAQSYDQISHALKLNPHEPVMLSEYAIDAAYLAVALKTHNATAAAQLASQALVASDLAIAASPYHPNYFKSRSRAAILLSELDPKYLDVAKDGLVQASLISPTDPRIPYNLGVIAKYQNKFDEAAAFFKKALQLKPDFADPQKALDELK